MTGSSGMSSGRNCQQLASNVGLQAVNRTDRPVLRAHTLASACSAPGSSSSRSSIKRQSDSSSVWYSASAMRLAA